MAKKWIQEAIQHPGALRKQLGVNPKTGKIPMDKLREAAQAKGTLGRRARLAITLRKLSNRKKESR